MRVLEAGRPQVGWSTEATCTGAGNGGGGCGARLLVEKGDLYKTFRHCRDETDTFITFACPCGVETDLGGGQSPPRNLALPDKAAWQHGRDQANAGRAHRKESE